MADKEVWGRGEVFAAMRAKFSLEYPPLISQEYSQEHPAEYRQNDSPEYSQLSAHSQKNHKNTNKRIK